MRPCRHPARIRIRIRRARAAAAAAAAYIRKSRAIRCAGRKPLQDNKCAVPKREKSISLPIDPPMHGIPLFLHRSVPSCCCADAGRCTPPVLRRLQISSRLRATRRDVTRHGAASDEQFDPGTHAHAVRARRSIHASITHIYVELGRYVRATHHHVRNDK